jgi:hypothetical protein
MWGWELAALKLAYTNSGWVVGTLVSPGNTFGFMAYADPHQPAAGYGGGSFCLQLGQDQGANSTVSTPPTGQGSVGSHDRFIFSESYKRKLNTQNTSSVNSYILQFTTTSGNPIKVTNTLQNAGTSSLDMWIYDGASWVLLGTSVTTYNDSSPYKKIVCDFDGANGLYDLYIDGVLEISASSIETFTGMTQINWRGGVNSNAPNGGFHDHCVLFDGGNHSTGALVVDAIPNNDDTVLIGAQTYKWKTALTAAANEVLIGASAALSRENLINAINLGPGSGTLYTAATGLNADVYAEENLGTSSVDVTAILKGVNTTATTTPVNTAGITGWGAATISGGDLDPTNDLALALGDIYIQGLLPTRDIVDGAFLNNGGPNDGTNVDLYANINDAQNLTDFIETTSSPDANEFGHEVRADIGGGTAATGTLTGTGFADGDTVTIGSQTYTLQAVLVDTANNVDAGGTLAQTMENLRRAINGDGVTGTNYGTGTPVNVDVTAVDTATTVVVTAIISGSGGDAITTTKTGSITGWAGATLAGGAENWMPSQIHALQTMQITRASGAITSGRTTLDIPSLGKVTSDPVALTTAGVIATTLRKWGTGNTTTDVDGIESGFEV